MKRRRALFALLLAVGWTTCIAVIPVAGVQGNVGEHSVEVYCLGTGAGLRQLAVSTPAIWASPITLPANVAVIGNQHPQWAAFRVHLYYSPDQRSWQYITSGPWFAAQVGDPVNTLMTSAWWNYDTQRYEQPVSANTWNLNWKGFYRVAVEYYWWADQYTGSGYDFIWANQHLDLTGSNRASTESCLGAV